MSEDWRHLATNSWGVILGVPSCELLFPIGSQLRSENLILGFPRRELKSERAQARRHHAGGNSPRGCPRATNVGTRSSFARRSRTPCRSGLSPIGVDVPRIHHPESTLSPVWQYPGPFAKGDPCRQDRVVAGEHRRGLLDDHAATESPRRFLQDDEARVFDEDPVIGQERPEDHRHGNAKGNRPSQMNLASGTGPRPRIRHAIPSQSAQPSQRIVLLSFPSPAQLGRATLSPRRRHYRIA